MTGKRYCGEPAFSLNSLPFGVFVVTLYANTVLRSVAGTLVVREESPGSIGRSTSENGSHWRQWDAAEENNRLGSHRGKGENVV